MCIVNFYCYLQSCRGGISNRKLKLNISVSKYDNHLRLACLYAQIHQEKNRYITGSFQGKKRNKKQPWPLK